MMILNELIDPLHIPLPSPIPKITPKVSALLFPYLSVFMVGIFIGFILTLIIRNRTDGKLNPFIIMISGFVALFLSFRYGFGMELVQGNLLCLLLLFASAEDIYTKEVPDYIPIMIAITAMISVNLADIPMMLLSVIIITIPQLAVAILKPGSYGGGDIKLMASCAFLLQIERSLLAICTGLSLAVVCTWLFHKGQKKRIKEPFALAPYLAIGCMMAFFI